MMNLIQKILFIFVAFKVNHIKITKAKPFEVVQFDLDALQDYADNLEKLETSEKILPEVESIEIFEKKTFVHRFEDFVKSKIEKQLEESSGDEEDEKHVEIVLDLVNVEDNSQDSWWIRAWRKVKDILFCPFRWLWNKAKSGGLHLAIKFDGMLADFKNWRDDFDLSKYIPENFHLIGDVEIAFVRITN